MAGLKLTPIILKEVNKYLTTPKKVRKFGFDDTTVKTGEDIERPQRALDREMFKDAEERFNKADGGRIGFEDGTKLKDLTTKQRQSNINKFINKNSKKAYDNLSRTSKRRVQLGENVVIDRKTLYTDTPKGKLREYIKNLPSGSTVNRQELAKKFGIKKTSIGNLTKVFQEFPNKNFKFKFPTENMGGPRIKATESQKNLAKFLFGKDIDDLTNLERSNIFTGKVDKNTMTKYRTEKIYDPIALKNYGKKFRELTEVEKRRIKDGLPPVDPNRIPANKAVVQKELLELSKDPQIMNIFENPNRTKLQYTKDLKRIKKILGKNVNAVARLTQLAAAVSGDDPIPGISTKLKKGADFVYNNLPHTMAQRSLDELKIGKIFGEKSIKTIKSDIRKTPGYIVSGDYNIDEVAGATSSVRRGTTPYGIFGQIIQQDINKKDKMSFDGNKSKKEKILQDAIQNAKNKGVNIKTDKNVKLALNDFNKLVSDYEQKINKNVPKGDLKVRLFKASLDSPEITIKNFDNFSPNYKNVFLNNYKNKGYSFNVPKDIKTIPQIARDVQSPKVTQKIAERADAGSARLYANPFFSPGVLGEAFKTIPTPLGAAVLTAGLGVDPTSAIDRAGIAAEAAFAPALVKQAAKFGPVAQKIFNLGASPKTALRIASRLSPIGIASLGLEGLYQVGKLGLESQRRFDALTPEQQAAERARQEAFAFDVQGAREGGLIGKKSGPAPISGPTPHGDEGLPAAFKRVKKQ
jgi:hypothetical protein